MKPINRTTTLIYKKGRKRKVEKHIKRIYYPDHNTGKLKPIITEPQDAKIYYNHYRLEVVKHDLFIGFSPKHNDLPFVRFTEPKTGATFAMWIKGFGKNTKETGIRPKNIEKHRFGAFYEMNNNVDIKFDVLGHMIRKKIIIKNRPDWNSITIRIVRAGGHLILGKKVGKNNLFYAFNNKDSLPLFSITKPCAWDSANKDILYPPNIIRLTTEVKNISLGVWDIIININPDDLDKAIYPVIIDPQIVLQPDAAEGKNADIGWHDSRNRGAIDWVEISWSSTDKNYTKGLYEFDLSDIPTNATINSSILELTQYNARCQYPGAGNVKPIKPHRLLIEWNEGNKNDAQADDGECTWYYAKYNQVAWTIAGAASNGNDRAEQVDPDAVTDYDCGVPYTKHDIDLTASTQDILLNTNYGWILERPPDDTGVYQTIAFFTDDATNTTYRPKLTITYTTSSVSIKIPITKWFNKVRPFKWI